MTWEGYEEVTWEPEVRLALSSFPQSSWVPPL